MDEISQASFKVFPAVTALQNVLLIRQLANFQDKILVDNEYMALALETIGFIFITLLHIIKLRICKTESLLQMRKAKKLEAEYFIRPLKDQRYYNNEQKRKIYNFSFKKGIRQLQSQFQIELLVCTNNKLILDYENILIYIRFSMKSFTNREQSRVQTSEPFKFKKVKNQQMSQKKIRKTQITRSYIHDKENMYEQIQQLKQENGQLQQLTKIQQTQINYFKEQEKRLVNRNHENSQGQFSKLRIVNFRQAEKISRLEQEIRKIKRSIKCTNIKELEKSNEEYLQRIKQLNAKVKAINRERNVTEINKIIENQYHLELKTKKLQESILTHKVEINKNVRLIRKLSNIIHCRDKQIKELRENIEQLNKNQGKKKNLTEYVHKSELAEKKKQVMNLTEGIEILERKLWQSENRLQILEAENIENMNRQAMKRKQIMNTYENLKKSHEALEQSLIQAMRKNNEASINQQIRLDKLPSKNQTEIRKNKVPFTIGIDHVKQTISEIIYNFQIHKITPEQAIEIICGQKESVSIRQLMIIFTNEPFNIHSYDEKEKLARYIVENNSSTTQYICFDEPQNIFIVKSILKKMLSNYQIFSEEDQIAYNMKINEFYKTYSFDIRANLISAIKELQRRNSIFHDGKFYRKIIIEAFEKENILPQEIISYMGFKTFELRNEKIALETFIECFSVGSEPTFLTENE